VNSPELEPKRGRTAQLGSLCRWERCHSGENAENKKKDLQDDQEKREKREDMPPDRLAKKPGGKVKSENARECRKYEEPQTGWVDWKYIKNPSYGGIPLTNDAFEKGGGLDLVRGGRPLAHYSIGRT